MIDIHEQFEVPAPPDRVWAVLSDPRQVVGCIPSAAIVGQNDDGTFDVTIGVKFGPARISFRARIGLTLDPAARQGEVVAQGKDSIGGTRVRSTARFAVAPHDDGSRSAVSIHGKAEVAGRLAGLIEGGAAIVVKNLSSSFADCLAARCAPGAQTAS